MFDLHENPKDVLVLTDNNGIKVFEILIKDRKSLVDAIIGVCEALHKFDQVYFTTNKQTSLPIPTRALDTAVDQIMHGLADKVLELYFPLVNKKLIQEEQDKKLKEDDDSILDAKVVFDEKRP